MVSRDARVNLLIGTGHFLSHFYQLCLPPLFLVWQRSFEVSFAELGAASALMSGVTALLQTPVGFLVDRHGARRFLIGGTLLMALSISVMGLATAFWQILVLAVLSGVGNSVIHPADYAILSGSVDKDRMGRSFALHTFSGNLGFAAAPPIMAALILALGWRGGLLLVGALGVPMVFAILLQSRILNDQAAPHPAETGPALSGRQLLLTRGMLLFLLFFMLSSMAGAGLQAWLITVLHQVKGMDLAVASTALTAYLAGYSGGTLAGGVAADRLKRHLALFVISFTTLSSVLLVVVDVLPIADLVAIALLLGAGLAMGASRTPRDVMVKDASPPGQIGKVFGFVSSGLPLGSALTPVPFGYLIDHHRPELVLVLAACLLMGSLLCMGSARASSSPIAVPAE
ncbi:MAG: MFS transporter [Acidisphaera sp.]|nr:MFS transporter [Acidisphaera sp.]